MSDLINAFEKSVENIKQIVVTKKQDGMSAKDPIYKSDNIESVEDAFELLEKGGSLNTSKLIKKKVQIHSQGKVFEGYRWVSAESGTPMSSSRESKDITKFKETTQKTKEKAKPEEKESIEDTEYNKKASDIVNSKEKFSNQVRDLIGLGIVDPVLICQAIPKITTQKLKAYIKEAGLDPKDFDEQLESGYAKAVGDKAEDSPTVQKDMAISDIQKKFGDKKAREIFEKRKEARQAAEGDDYHEKFKSYRFLLDQMVQDKDVRSAIIYGTGGIGKSYNLLDPDEGKMAKNGKIKFNPELDLSKDEYDYVEIGGNISALGMYKTLLANKDKFVVFDDCDSMWNDEQMANMLKKALDTTGDRMVTWGKNMTKDQDTGLVPQKSFKFTGQIIFISNLSEEGLGKFGKPLLESRCVSLDMSMSMDQTLDMIDEIKDVMKIKDVDGNVIKVSKSDRADIVKLLREVKNDLPIERVNGRTLYNLAILRQSFLKHGNTDWKDFVKEAKRRLKLI